MSCIISKIDPSKERIIKQIESYGNYMEAEEEVKSIVNVGIIGQ